MNSNSGYMKLKKGYMAKITSWENDADNYQTHQIDGLTEKELNCLIDFCKFHYSKNGFGKMKGFGNMYEPSAAEIKNYLDAIRTLMTKDLESFRSLFQIEDENDEVNHFDEIIRSFTECIGLSCNSECYTRVFNTIEIFYIPTDIEIQNVTSKFLN